MRLLLFIFFLQTSLTFAVVPEQIRQHIDRDSKYIETLKDLAYSEPQKELVIDRYIDNLISEYNVLPSQLDASEVRELLKSKLTAGLAKSEPAKYYTAKPNVDLKAFAEDIIDDRWPEFSKIDVEYKGFKIPLFVKLDYGKVNIFLDGINKDSTKQAPGLSSGSGPSSFERRFERREKAMQCLKIAIKTRSDVAELDILNASLTACPIPGEKSGTFLLGLAEELARRFGKTSMQLYDGSSIKCPKNNEFASLARLRTFLDGDTWYGSHGYRAFGTYDKKIIQAHRSFPLLTVKTELDALAKKGLDELKVQLLRKQSFSSDKERIEKDFSQFAALKPMFDESVAEFLGGKTLSESLPLSDFLGWLWIKDCVRYVALEQFLYANDVNKGLSLRSLEPLPIADLKKSLVDTSSKEESKK